MEPNGAVETAERVILVTKGQMSVVTDHIHLPLVLPGGMIYSLNTWIVRCSLVTMDVICSA